LSSRSEIQLASRPVLSHAADAVAGGGLLFVAGILPVEASGALVGDGDVGAQTTYVLDDLEAILAAGGCTLADVARLSVFVTDIDDAPEVIAAQRSAFGDVRPAGTLVGVRGLAIPGARVEVDAVAVRP
jgi:2-iminobutanoate/2-iminopropanoate deaminase